MQTTTPAASAFVGSIPANYEQHLGPMFFRPYAIDMAERVAKLSPKKILEVAAGTGISTEELAKIAGVDIIATDLNPAMIEIANAVRPNLGVEWQPADAQDLPFEDNSFDAVVIQFGVMFFPDKMKGIEEAFRVLKPGGTLFFNVWESLLKNDVSRIANEVVIDEFKPSEPQFMKTPFGNSATGPWLERLKDAGFQPELPVWVPKEARATSAMSAASGIIGGTPLIAEINQLGLDATRIKERVANSLAAQFGDNPMVASMEAIVFTAKKPA